jgi:type I restriction enzyme S subunit
MEVRPEYKRTEVGVFPTEWKVEPLGEHATFRTGPFGSALHKSDYTNDGVPVINPMHIDDGNIAPTRTMTVTENAAKKLSDFRMRPGEIVIGRRGDMGRCAVVRAHQSGWLCGTGSMIIRPLNADAGYLQRVLSSPRAISAIEDSSVGTTMVNLNQGILAGLKIQLPPLPEQRAIAAALSDVDALLGGLDRLIAKKRDLKQAAMQQLLTGQTRLPGFHGEWEVKTLFDLAERKKELFDDGDWIESEHITTQGIRLIQTGNIGVGSFMEKEVKKFIYEKSFTSLRCKQLKTDDLLVCRLADPAGRACVLPDIGEERIVTSVDVTIFRPPHEIADRVFLANVFSTPEWFRTVSDRSGGTTHKRISRGALGRIAIKLPPRAEQTAIAAVLCDMDTELSALESRRDKTSALKQAMMQELLTGRTRLVASGAEDRQA